MSTPTSTLAVVPVYVRSEIEKGVTCKTLETLRAVEPDLEVVVVDDQSPDRDLASQIREYARSLGMRFKAKPENEGYSKTINVGLRQALDEGKNVVTLNADMEFFMPFVDRMVECCDSQDRPAAVVGALLLYPNGMIQHAGCFFSLLARNFDHRFRYAPGGLPEAQVPKVCPVTGAMQFIRHSTLETVGLYDETFSMAHEDMDYCIRVFDEGLECVYDPGVRAIHHESLFRSTGQEARHSASWSRLIEKHANTSMGQWVPEVA